MIQGSSVAACAARGAALLDEKRPHWAELVSITALDMASNVKCILGQVYGDYRDGLRSLFSERAHDAVLSDYYGFSAFDIGGGCTAMLSDSERTVWNELGHAWRGEICRRRIKPLHVPEFLAQDGVALSA